MAKRLKYLPDTMKQNMAWYSALYAFDLGETEPLGNMIAAGNQIPSAFAPIIGAIVRGDRQPNKKASAKLKISPSARFHIARRVLTETDPWSDRTRFVDVSIERIEAVASKYDVSPYTIKSMLREFRDLAWQCYRDEKAVVHKLSEQKPL